MRRMQYRRPSRHAMAWAVLLAMVLVFTQALGAMHRIAHGGAASQGTAADHAFGHTAGSGDCQLFDQFTHADAPTAAPPALAATACEAAAPQAADRSIAGSASPLPFLARGPPALA
jgi:hypothetical protein